MKKWLAFSFFWIFFSKKVNITDFLRIVRKTAKVAKKESQTFSFISCNCDLLFLFEIIYKK